MTEVQLTFLITVPLNTEMSIRQGLDSWALQKEEEYMTPMQ